MVHKEHTSAPSLCPTTRTTLDICLCSGLQQPPLGLDRDYCRTRHRPLGSGRVLSRTRRAQRPAWWFRTSRGEPHTRIGCDSQLPLWPQRNERRSASLPVTGRRHARRDTRLAPPALLPPWPNNPLACAARGHRKPAPTKRRTNRPKASPSSRCGLAVAPARNRHRAIRLRVRAPQVAA
jgi:hypothetical protein